MITTLRIALTLIVFGIATIEAAAQMPGGIYIGTPGWEDLSGSYGPDYINPLGGRDRVYDCPPSSSVPPPDQTASGGDGKKDKIDTEDGEADTIYMGSEDVLLADPDDYVIIWVHHRSVWEGKYSKFLQWKKLFDRLRHRLITGIGQLGTLAGLAAERAANQALLASVADETGAICLQQWFTPAELEPVADKSGLASVPLVIAWFPDEVSAWYEDTYPDIAGEDDWLSPAEFTAALGGIDVLLEEAQASVTDGGDGDDATDG